MRRDGGRNRPRLETLAIARSATRRAKAVARANTVLLTMRLTRLTGRRGGGIELSRWPVGEGGAGRGGGDGVGARERMVAGEGEGEGRAVHEAEVGLCTCVHNSGGGGCRAWSGSILYRKLSISIRYPWSISISTNRQKFTRLVHCSAPWRRRFPKYDFLVGNGTPIYHALLKLATLPLS